MERLRFTSEVMIIMNFAITIIYTKTHTICVKMVTANDKKDACFSCREIYRHSDFKILSVVAVPDDANIGMNFS